MSSNSDFPFLTGWSDFRSSFWRYWNSLSCRASDISRWRRSKMNWNDLRRIWNVLESSKLFPDARSYFLLFPLFIWKRLKNSALHFRNGVQSHGFPFETSFVGTSMIDRESHESSRLHRYVTNKKLFNMYTLILMKYLALTAFHLTFSLLKTFHSCCCQMLNKNKLMLASTKWNAPTKNSKW